MPMKAYTLLGVFMLFKTKLLLAVCLLSALACAHESQIKAKKVTYCKEPRPQMCTMDYTPVCGLVDNKAVKTFGNACGACGDKKVSQHIKGECQADSIKQFDVAGKTSEVNSDSKKE